MAVAFSLFGNLGLRTSDFEAGTRKAKAELTQLQQAAQTSSVSLAGMGRALGGLAAGAVGLAAIKSGLQDIVQTGLKMEQLRASFSAITGSAQQGRAEFQFITQTANRLGLDITQLAENYRGLTAATRGTALAGQETRDLFTALTQASRTFGLTNEQTGRALLAFQQIISKGKVSQEELRGQLGEALPGASQIAARAFGVTTQELDKMIEKGVDATEFVRKMTAQLGRETPQAVDQVGKGIAQLGNELVLWKDRLAKDVLPIVERIAATAAGILRGQREAAEGQSERIQIRAQAGVEDFSKLLPDNQRRLLEISEKVVQAEQRVLEFQRMPAIIGAARAARAQQELDALRAQQTELQALIKLRDKEMQQDRQRTELPMGPGGEFVTVQKAEEEARKKAQTLAIQTELDLMFKEEARLDDERKKRLDEEQRTTAQAAEQRVQLFRQTNEAQERYLQGLRDEVDRQSMSEAALRRKLLTQQALEPLQREEADRLLEQLDAIENMTAERAFFLEVEQAVRKEQEETASHRERVMSRIAREVEADEKKRLRELESRTEAFADFFTDTILSATEIGKRGFADFADSAIRSLQRIVMQQFIAPHIKGWADIAIKAIGTLFTPSAGPGVSEGSAAGLSGEGALFSANLGSRQHGGPMMPNRFYEVHRNEVIWSGGMGAHATSAQQRSSGITINGPLMVIQTPNAQSFERSQGEYGNRLAGTLRRLQRDA